MTFIQKMPIIALGSLMIAIAIHVFITPHRIMEGGVIGIGLLGYYAFEANIALTILLCSLPVYAIVWRYRKMYIINNFIGALTTAGFIALINVLTITWTVPPLPSALIGGSLIGAAVGMMLRSDISTDGIDLLAHMLGKMYRINSGILIFVFDLVIVSAGIFFIAERQLLLSLIAVAAVGVVTTAIGLIKK